MMLQSFNVSYTVGLTNTGEVYLQRNATDNVGIIDMVIEFLGNGNIVMKRCCVCIVLVQYSLLFCFCVLSRTFQVTPALDEALDATFVSRAGASTIVVQAQNPTSRCVPLHSHILHSLCCFLGSALVFVLPVVSMRLN